MRLIRKLPGRNKNNYYESIGLFYCEYCGNEVEKRRTAGLIAKSCGCMKNKLIGKANIKHGGSYDRLYSIWSSILKRCYSKKNISYKYYGERGIYVCSRWHNYIVFKTWALLHGYKDNLTIDRKNNDKWYDPNNCKWSTYKEQNNNRRKFKKK